MRDIEMPLELSWFVNQLTDEEAGEVIKAIFHYVDGDGAKLASYKQEAAFKAWKMYAEKEG